MWICVYVTIVFSFVPGKHWFMLKNVQISKLALYAYLVWSYSVHFKIQCIMMMMTMATAAATLMGGGSDSCSNICAQSVNLLMFLLTFFMATALSVFNYHPDILPQLKLLHSQTTVSHCEFWIGFLYALDINEYSWNGTIWIKKLQMTQNWAAAQNGAALTLIFILI